MTTRTNFLLVLFEVAMGVLLIRVGYWQIVKHDELAARADQQHFDRLILAAPRGEILASDGSVLVGNARRYLLFAYKPDVTDDHSDIARVLADTLNEPSATATDIARRLDRRSSWEMLGRDLTITQKEAIETLNIAGLGFEPSGVRFYADASASAHVLGLVGKDAAGQPLGYFGLEGFYHRELEGVSGYLQQERDALGNPILVGSYQEIPALPGRTLVTHLDRYVQQIAEEELLKGMERTSAAAGEAIVMDMSGAIIASASFPNYDPSKFWLFDPSFLKNPTISESYEPGSTFKVVVMAAAIEEGAVTPETICDSCDGPVSIGPYLIRTWNEQYRPGISMTDVIIHSDNTGMVFVSQKLGKERLVLYLKQFGFGEKTGVDLQEESASKFRERWGDIDAATASFGQGVAVTSMQMIRAVGAIASGGMLMTPQVVKDIRGDRPTTIDPKPVRRVISQGTARIITEMMVKAVQEGEAKFAAPKGYRIAGKTGTAQIPVSGHYDEEKTIASFIGFAPADDPKFIMLVKLREPTSSPWGSETAAPLWFSIAKRLFTYWGIPPEAEKE